MIDFIKITFETFIGFLHQFTNIVSKGDPTINGLATLAILGSFGFLLRKSPVKIFNLIKKRLTLRYIVVSDLANHEESFYYEQLSIKISKFITKPRNFQIRYLVIDGVGKCFLGTGTGWGWFRLGTSLVFFSKNETTDGKQQRGVIEFISLGASKNTMTEFLQNINTDEKRKVFDTMPFARNPLKKVDELEDEQFNINPKIKKAIDDALEAQRKNKLIFQQKGISNKLNIFLDGPPGTGKTTLIKYISQKTNKDIVKFSPAILQYPEVEAKVQSSNCIVAAEDIDRNNWALEPQVKKKPTEEDPEIVEETQNNNLMVSLLNYLDGIGSNADRIVVITSNNTKKLIRALYRPNRIDLHLHIGYEKKEDFERCLKFYFPNADHTKYSIPDNFIFSNAICANLYKKHHDSEETWVKELLLEGSKLNPEEGKPNFN